MHPSLNPHRPQLLIVPSCLVENARVVMGNQRQSAVLVRVLGQDRGQNDNGIPVYSHRRVEQDADRIGAGCARVFGDAVWDVGFRGEVPQQVVEFFGLAFGVAEDAHAVALLPGFVHQFGGVEVAGGGGVLGEDVEPVALVLVVPAGGAGSWAAGLRGWGWLVILHGTSGSRPAGGPGGRWSLWLCRSSRQCRRCPGGPRSSLWRSGSGSRLR